MYNQAFDLYHCVYRTLQIIYRFQENERMEIDRVRVWDFYLLFPYKIYDIKLSRDMVDARKLRKSYVAHIQSPYEVVDDGRKLLERLRPYQESALKTLVSYGVIDKEELQRNYVKISDRTKLLDIISKLERLSATENNVISWLNSYFKTVPMNGRNGLKAKTELLIYRYDGF